MSKLGLLESYHDSTSWILLMSKPGDVRSTICQNRNLNTKLLPAKLSRSKVRGLQHNKPTPRALNFTRSQTQVPDQESANANLHTKNHQNQVPNPNPNGGTPGPS